MEAHEPQPETDCVDGCRFGRVEVAVGGGCFIQRAVRRLLLGCRM